MEFKHKSVLLEECLQGLNIKEDGIYVDGTLGGGGHSFHILKKLTNTGKLIGIDRDNEAIKAATNRLKDFNNKILYRGNHDDIKNILDELKIEKVDGILMDLGVSSYQLDEASRGFSYMQDSRLDMRMDQDSNFSAYDVINKYSFEKLVSIFKDYGEEKYASSIANKICKVRETKSIDTTFELVDIIKSSIPYTATKEKQHPAKRVFQAIRIEVNNELGDLKRMVIDAVDKLAIGGRLAIITFHSLEDRIVKHTYEELEGKCTCPSGFPVCVCGYVSHGKVITKTYYIYRRRIRRKS